MPRVWLSTYSYARRSSILSAGGACVTSTGFGSRHAYSSKRYQSTIYRSPFPEPALPEPTSLFHFHFPAAGLEASRKDLPAYTDALTGQTLTQGQVRSTSLRMGYGMKQLPRLAKGDVALIFSPNSLEYAIAFFACQASGLVVTPASASYTPHELAYHIKDSTAKIAFVHPDLMDTFEKAQQVIRREDASQEELDVYRLTPEKSASDQDERSFWELMVPEDDMGDWRGETLGPGEEHDAAVLCYSSGTVNTTFDILYAGIDIEFHAFRCPLCARLPCFPLCLIEKDWVAKR